MAIPLLAPSGYKALLKTRRAAQPAPSTDPFAATSPQAINQTVNRFSGMYGTPQTDAQIQAGAQAQLDPIIAAITKNIQGQAGAASSAIRGNSDSLARSLGAIDYAAPYTGAEHDQAAVGASLRQALAGGGDSLAADLTNRLGVIGDPTVAAAGGAVGAYGTGTGNTELASGSANLGQLLALGAGAKAYGLKQPGLARMQGLQDIAGVQQNATTQIGNQTSQALSQLPNIVQAMRSANQSLRGDKAGAAAQIYETLTGQNVTKATAKAGLQNTAFDNNLNAAQTFGFDPVTGAPTVAETKAQTAATTAAAKVKAGKAPKSLTTTDKARLSTSAENLRFGIAPKQHYDSKTSTWVDVPNTGTPNASYNEAYNTLVAQGASPKYARTQVNRLYKPGEYGRPQSASQKKTAKAVKSGLGVQKLTGPLAGLGG